MTAYELLRDRKPLSMRLKLLIAEQRRSSGLSLIIERSIHIKGGVEAIEVGVEPSSLLLMHQGPFPYE